MERRRLFTIVFSVGIIILLLAYPTQTLLAAREGFALWRDAVLPALFPFFVAAQMLRRAQLPEILATVCDGACHKLFRCSGLAAFAFLLSVLGGYPVGARLIGQFRRDGRISIDEAERMLSFCSTSGPMFMIGSVGAGMLGNPGLGLIIALAHFAAAIMMGLLFRFRGAASARSMHHTRESVPPLGEILGDAVQDGMRGMLAIAGFLMLFLALYRLCHHIGLIALLAAPLRALLSLLRLSPGIAEPLLAGAFEMSIGAQAAAQSNAPLLSQAVAISFSVGFGGFSIALQSLAFLSGTGIRASYFLLLKLLQGTISAILCTLLLSFSAGTSLVASTSAGIAAQALPPSAIWALTAPLSVALILSLLLLRRVKRL